MRVVLPHNFTPRPYQREPMAYLDRGGKRAVTVWHRRGGKDLTGMHQLCKMAHRRVASYWHIFPTAEQGRKAIWTEFTKDGERIMEQVFPKAIRKTPKEWAPQAEMVVELKCGSIYRVLGSDRIEVVGAGPAGVLFSEYSVAKPRTWDLIRPMLREKDGWAWFNFTPRGKNHAWKLLEMARVNPDWFVDVKTLYDTHAYDPESTISEERASGMPEDLIAQEYLCDFNAANVGSFWGAQVAQLEKRGAVCAFEPPGRDDVFTSWDLGKADDTAVWWWRPRPGGLDVLDHYASHGEDLEHYFGALSSRAERYGWRYRKHWLPHDARAKTLATKASVLDQFMAEYPGQVAIVPDMLLLDGIAAGRRLLSHQGLRIHKRCSEVSGPKDCDGLEALRAYHREWDDEHKCFREKPVHDWASHCFVGATEVLTRHGTCRMDMLPSAGEVMTPCGWKPYRSPRLAKRSAPLVEVRFTDGHSVRCTPEHMFSTELGWRSAESLWTGMQIQSCWTPSPSIGTEASIDCGPASATSRKAERVSTEQSGRAHSDPSRPAATSTTATETQPTTAWTTSNACPRVSTCPEPGRKPRAAVASTSPTRPDGLPRSGIARPPDASGTSAMPSGPSPGPSGAERTGHVDTAARPSPPSSVTAATARSGAPPSARPLRIASVVRLDEVADVWDITVPGVECFALANGAIVHNSADSWRYLATVAEVEGHLAVQRARQEEKRLRHGQPVGVRSMANLGTLEELWDTAYSGSEEGRV